MRWYPQINTLDPALIRQKLTSFYDEDMPAGDPSSRLLRDLATEPVSASFTARSTLIFAGAAVLKEAFSADCSLQLNVRDGQDALPGQVLATVRGPVHELLSRERVVLNLLQRLSATATLTQQYVQAAQGDFLILDTRKCTPGLRLLEKYAVRCGGGSNHRMNLSSGIMLKDNHLAAGIPISLIMKNARRDNPDLLLEVEVDRPDQLPDILDSGPDALLLDNMSPDTIKICVEIIRRHPGGGEIFIEASGGIGLQQIPLLIGSGINAVSVGALTHSAPSVDIALDVSPAHELFK